MMLRNSFEVERLAHLTTQLNWRLNEGSGEAFYEVRSLQNELVTILTSIRLVYKTMEPLLD